MNLSRLLTRKTLSFLQYYDVLDKVKDDIEIIEYGLILFYSNLFKGFIIFLIAFITGFLKDVLVCAIIFGILRSYAGGIHAKTPIGCLAGVIFLYSSIIYLSYIIPYSNYLFWFSLIFCTLIIALYAPADVAEKPIICKKQKKQYKLYSLIILLSAFIISFFFFDEIIKKIIIFSCVIESITMLPIVYKITNTKGGDYYYE